MDEFDDKLRAALRAGHKLEIGGDEIDSVRGLITEIFRFRNRLILAGAVFKMCAFLAVALVAFVCTFLAEDERSRFLWAFGSLFSAVALSIVWQFHWMVLNRNAVLRELKRLELQIAESARGRERD